MEHRIEVYNNLGNNSRALCLTENLRRLFRTQGLVSVNRPVNVILGFMDPQTVIDVHARLAGLFVSGVGGPRVEGRHMMIDTGAWNNFDIMLHPRLRVDEVAETLAHESVHICQFVTGRLRLIALPGAKLQVWEDGLVPNDTKYENLPWEREAHAMQVALGNTVNM